MTNGLARKDVPLNRLNRSRRLFVHRLTVENITALRAGITSGGCKKSILRIKTVRVNIKHRLCCLCRTCQKRCHLDCCTIGGRIISAVSYGDKCSSQSRTFWKVSKPLKFLEGNDEIRANFQQNSIQVMRKILKRTLRRDRQDCRLDLVGN